MIRRLYLFIVLGTLIENSYHAWLWMGFSEDFVYYTVFPTLQRAEICLLPLWWIMGRLKPVRGDDRHEAWAYLVASTYFIFQLVDAIDMYTNANQRPAWLDLFLFAAINVAIWVVMRTRR